MKIRIIFSLLVLVSAAFAGNAMAGSEVDDNTLYGKNAGSLITTSANNNTFVGYEAGYAGATANNNSFFGYQAGWNDDTGNDNVFIGYQAGYNNTGG